MQMLPITLRVNCGFARVGLVRSSEEDFKSTFQAPLKLEDNYFQRRSDRRTCSSYETHVKAMHVQGMFILCLTSDKVVGSFQV